MKKITSMLRQTFCTLLSCLFVFTGVMVAQAALSPAVVAKAATASDNAYVYYVSNGSLYRVMSDGTKEQRLVNSFQGVQLTPAGNYLYYMYDERSTTLLRIPMDGSAVLPSRFQSDVVHFVVDGDFIYYMNDKGAIYRASVNAKKASEAKLITDMADTKHPGFVVIEGRVYYNALKSGRTTWVASKAANGSGQVQWIASGAIPNPWFTRTDKTSIYMMINTKPEETRYSLNCMVLYSIPKKGGAAKALNLKTPLNANSVYSGWWTNGYFLFNNGISLDLNGEYDYTTSKGCIMDMKGNMIQIHDTGIYEIANIAPNKLVFVDAYGNAFVSTLNNNKIVNKKQLSINYAGYVRNLMTDGKVGATMLFAQSGAYMLQPDLSLKKMVGIEWDLCMYKDNVPGFFYVNAGDNGRLYHMNNDGKTSTKLSDKKVKRIVLISKPNAASQK
ncbi:DUF5050 domain-containing protein [Clostridium ganghwense]|uniref:DUF5050 domain-containing protein n=1 Tax=Clostridium ganghwense TaxID=312089 RepID=A0ABT4CLI9_9CLOT|nr:DUF5050 domain-containing protein [Clostridium ganghwense]MCY6369343.1 DUF5050 domain-containing protein [Clostridium ganghwense]